MTLTRRAFLQNSAAATSWLACADVLPLRCLAETTATPLRAWVTAADRRFEQLHIRPWRSAAAPAGAGTIVIDPAQRFQSVLGFGGAFTDASCFLFSRMEPQARESLMHELFSPSGLSLSMGRTCMGASDYSRTVYTYDDSSAPDPDLKHFSIEHDRAYILPMLREALHLNPDMFYFSTPWSPPGWMKAGDSILGGSMRKEYFGPYAEYFVKFLDGYRAAGVPVRAVTSQNEVDTDQNGRMPATLWGQEYEISFVKSFLGPALRKAAPDTKIWILDHNYNLWGRAIDELSDPGVFEYADGVAWHGYYGSPEAMTRVHDAFPTKHAYWTEGGPDITDPEYAVDWAKWSSTFTGILRNWARCIVSWNLLLNEKGQPNIGPFTCGGVVTIDSHTGKLTRSGQYWAFSHYSKLIRRGARVLGSWGETPGVEHVALANPGGGYVLVLTNPGNECSVHCRFQGRTLAVDLPGNSIVTVEWS